MKIRRRAFLKGLTALPFAGFAGSAAAKKRPDGFRLMNRFTIAGFQYYDGPAFLNNIPPGKELKIGFQAEAYGNREIVMAFRGKDFGGLSMSAGDRLILLPEPDNPHDPFAVEIFFKTVKLGYVPRSDNRHISRLLLQNVPLVCRAFSVEPEELPWEMVKAEVGLETI